MRAPAAECCCSERARRVLLVGALKPLYPLYAGESAPSAGHRPTPPVGQPSSAGRCCPHQRAHVLGRRLTPCGRPAHGEGGSAAAAAARRLHPRPSRDLRARDFKCVTRIPEHTPLLHPLCLLLAVTAECALPSEGAGPQALRSPSCAARTCSAQVAGGGARRAARPLERYAVFHQDRRSDGEDGR